jgi:hypothetical protein
MDDMSRLEDNFNLTMSVVDLTIDKGLARSGRYIKASSSCLILYFNFVFSASKPPMESSRESLVSL